MRSNRTVKMKMSSNKGLENKILHERAKIWKKKINMLINKISYYKRKLGADGRIFFHPHDDLTIFHDNDKDSFPLVKICLQPLGGIPDRFSVFSHLKGDTKYTNDLEPGSLEAVFENLLQKK